MKENGVITKLLPNNCAEVAIKRNAACEKCGLCHGVGEGMMGLKARNQLGAQPNDEVIIEIPSEVIVKASIIIFLFPIFFLIVGYFLIYSLTGSEILSVMAAILALWPSFYFSRWYDQNIEQKNVCQAQVVKIIGRS